MCKGQLQPTRYPEEDQQLKANSGSPADDRGDGGSANPQLREGPNSKDQEGIQQNIESVSKPKDPHGHGGIPCASERCVQKFFGTGQAISLDVAKTINQEAEEKA